MRNTDLPYRLNESLKAIRRAGRRPLLDEIRNFLWFGGFGDLLVC